METLTPQVGQTIFKQLGGYKFMAMTGANTLVVSEDALSMQLPRNLAKAKYLRIEIAADDTYTMIFRKAANKDFEFHIAAKVEGVYSEMLQEVFTKITGLLTTL